MKCSYDSWMSEGLEGIDERWLANPIASKLKLLPAKQKGEAFEKIAKRLLQDRGFSVEKRESSDHDFKANLRDSKVLEKIEVKGSMINKVPKKENMFSFLQIRPNDDYSLLLLVCFFFDHIETYYLTKEQVRGYIQQGVFRHQHGGKKENSETYSYNGPITNLTLATKIF